MTISLTFHSYDSFDISLSPAVFYVVFGCITFQILIHGVMTDPDTGEKI